MFGTQTKLYKSSCYRGCKPQDGKTRSVDTMQKNIDLPARYAQPRLLGIDEHSHRKGKKDFSLILTDLDRGIIVDLLLNSKRY